MLRILHILRVSSVQILFEVTVFTCVRNTSRSIHNASVLSFQRPHGSEVTSFAALGFLLIHTMTGCWTRRAKEREQKKEEQQIQSYMLATLSTSCGGN